MTSAIRSKAIGAVVAVAATIALMASPAHALHPRLGLSTSQIVVSVLDQPAGAASYTCTINDFPQTIVWANAGTTNIGARGAYFCTRGAARVDFAMFPVLQYNADGTARAAYILSLSRNGQNCATTSFPSEFIRGQNFGDQFENVDNQLRVTGRINCGPSNQDFAAVTITFTEGVRRPV